MDKTLTEQEIALLRKMCIRDSLYAAHFDENFLYDQSNPKIWEAIYNAVSYTHLDVYKRQR